jgi:hypothetical protein
MLLEVGLIVNGGVSLYILRRLSSNPSSPAYPPTPAWLIFSFGSPYLLAVVAASLLLIRAPDLGIGSSTAIGMGLLLCPTLIGAGAWFLAVITTNSYGR